MAQSSTSMSTYGYVPRCLAAASMPHSRPESDRWARQSGNFQLIIHAGAGVGLPYGSYARLFSMWLATQVVVLRKEEVVVDGTFTDFLHAFDLNTDGRTRRRFRDQCVKFLRSTFELDGIRCPVASMSDVWWDIRRPDEPTLFETRIRVGAGYYDHVAGHSLPLPMASVIQLKRSSFCMDIFSWFAYRVGYLRSTCFIPFRYLAGQFGADYSRPRMFRARFRQCLARVLDVYPMMQFRLTDEGIEIHPSIPPVFKKLSTKTCG